MKGFFLDTNVIIDFLANRQPFADTISRLFDLSAKGKVSLHISALTYSNLYYIIRKTTTHTKMISILEDLESMTETLDVTKRIIQKSLKSDFKDFEDAIQYQTAVSSKKVNAIVTRDKRGFQKSELSVLSPDEALSILSNTKS